MKQKLLRLISALLVLGLGISVLASASAAGIVSGRNQAIVFSDPAQTVSADPGLTAKGFTLSFEDEILINLYYTVADLTGVTEHGMLVFREAPAVVDIASADEVYNQPIYDAAGNRYMATTDGIAAKYMGDTRYYAVYAKTADGIFYTKAYDYSPKKYSMNLLGRDSTSDKQKALCVAMLNYGAAAQEYFGYRTDDLMNAGLTAQQKALVMPYDAACFRGSVAADGSKTGSFTATGFSGKSATVSFEGAFAINYYFVPSSTVSGDMKLYIWNPEAYAAVDQLTETNASAVVSMKAQDSGAYWGQVQGIAAKMLDETYYVAGVYTDGQGNRCTTGVIAYSLSKYCLNNAKPGREMEALAANTAMYGYYAARYFGTDAPISTEPTLIVSSVTAESGAAGVQVTVSIKNNPGIAGMTLCAEYDDSVLTLTKVTTQTALSGLTFQKPKTYKNGCNLVWYGVEPRDVVDGEAFVLIFTVSADAATGTYPIRLVYSSGYDAALGSVELEVISGSIAVSG